MILLQFIKTNNNKNHKLLSTIYFTSDDILKIIKNPDPNKTHGHDMISIQIIKILELTFQSCLENGRLPTERKNANAVLAHKKGDKQSLKNYRPMFLLPVVGKLFERILYNKHV